MRLVIGSTKQQTVAALEQRGERELAAPALAVLGDDHSNGGELALVAAEPVQRRGDVLDHVPDAEVLGEHLAKAQRVRRRIALRHQQPDHALLA